MSTLQMEAKPLLVPLIKGIWMDLTPEAQATLSRWATMFTMVVEHADQNTLATPSDQRQLMAKYHQIPARWWVWTAPFDGTRWKGVFNHFGWRLERSKAIPRARIRTPNSQSTAFVVGRVFIMSFSTTSDIRFDGRLFAKQLGLASIWPPEPVSVDRPIRTLDDFAANDISGALLPANFPRRPAWVAY